MARQQTDSAALTTTGIAGVIAGGGIVTFALFPLAIPFLLLPAVFTAPLALIGIGAAVPIGIIAVVVLAVRAIGRRLASRRGSSDRPVASPSIRTAAGSSR
jgi:hypothetical protein